MLINYQIYNQIECSGPTLDLAGLEINPVYPPWNKNPPPEIQYDTTVRAWNELLEWLLESIIGIQISSYTMVYLYSINIDEKSRSDIISFVLFNNVHRDFYYGFYIGFVKLLISYHSKLFTMYTVQINTVQVNTMST